MRLNVIGATLNQFFKEDDKECSGRYFSRALSGTERRYSVYEYEMLAVV